MNLTLEQAALLLARLPKIGPRTAKKLIDHFKDSRDIFSARPDKLLKINGLGESHLKSIRHWEAIFPRVVKEEEEIKKQALSLNTYGSNAYPLPLSFTADPPIVFFQKGEVNWQNKRVISIVGTREPTSRGLVLCRTLVEQLAPYRPLIVSGFARGIDIEAHRTALCCGLETEQYWDTLLAGGTLENIKTKLNPFLAMGHLSVSFGLTPLLNAKTF